MSAVAKPKLTPDEYLALERAAEFRSEYYRGEMFAVAGATERHVTIVSNLVYRLRGRLEGGRCRVFSNDMRVRVSDDGLYTYPDVVVACGQLEFLDARRDTLLNPKLIIEVLSESTSEYDRGQKFAQYRLIESLREYVVVWQTEPRIQRFVRRDDGMWTFAEVNEAGQSLRFDSLDCDVPLGHVYEQIDFTSTEA